VRGWTFIGKRPATAADLLAEAALRGTGDSDQAIDLGVLAARVFVTDNDNNAGGYRITNLGTPTLDSDAVTKTYVADQIATAEDYTDTQVDAVPTGLDIVTAGDGLSKSGNTLAVNVDSSTIEIATDILRVKTGGIGETQLASAAVTALKVANLVDWATLVGASGNGLSMGAVISGLTAGEDIAMQNVCYMASDEKVYKCDANDLTKTYGMLLSCAAVSNGNAGNFLLAGLQRYDTNTWTAAGALYVSETPGGPTQTAPTTANVYVSRIGWAFTTHILLFWPNFNFPTHI
jgi:hypothetical protein